LRGAWIAALLALAGCSSKSEAPPSGQTVSSADVAAAREVFATRCAACHGARGRGDGPASQSLTPRPRDFHDKDWQRQIADERIERTVQFGGASMGKSVAMPANPDLSTPVVRALRDHIRALARD
jgi:mono/diheme cytochrome c family protein